MKNPELLNTIDKENNAGQYVNALVILRDLPIEDEEIKKRIYEVMHDLLDLAENELTKTNPVLSWCKKVRTRIMFNQSK